MRQLRKKGLANMIRRDFKMEDIDLNTKHLIGLLETDNI